VSSTRSDTAEVMLGGEAGCRLMSCGELSGRHRLLVERRLRPSSLLQIAVLGDRSSSMNVAPPALGLVRQAGLVEVGHDCVFAAFEERVIERRLAIRACECFVDACAQNRLRSAGPRSAGPDASAPGAAVARARSDERNATTIRRPSASRRDGSVRALQTA